MKVSISLPDDDLEFLDGYTQQTGLASRSAAVQKAIRLLRTAELSAQYAAAYEEWANSEDAALWETTIADGLDPQ